MTLGYFAPLPPVRSGVADYAARMLSALRNCGEVRVNESGSINLYQIGNNRLHASIYRRALAEPGVVLLHDALLQHLFLGEIDGQAYVDEFAYNYGAWTRDLAASLWDARGRAMSDPRFFRYPMLKRLTERSLAVVVHSEAARKTVRHHDAGVRVKVIPHLSLEDPESAPAHADRDRFRREELGLGQSDFLLGVYGYLRESKRLGVVLAALDSLRQRGIPATLLVAGAFASDDYARTLESRLAGHPAVILRGATGEGEFRLLLAAADVCVNLKYPSVGESSGIAMRAMALGVPVLLSEGSEAGSYPAGSFVPVPPGPAELPTLVESLAWLFSDARTRRGIANAAREHCIHHCNPATIGAELWTWMASLTKA